MEFKGRGHRALTGEECYFRAKWVSGVRTRLNTAGVRPPTLRHKMQDLNIHARSHKSSNTHMKGLLRDTQHFDPEPSLGTYSPQLFFLAHSCLKQDDLPHLNLLTKCLIFSKSGTSGQAFSTLTASFLQVSKSRPIHFHLTSKNSIFLSIFLQSSHSLSKSPCCRVLKLWLHVCSIRLEKKILSLIRPRSYSARTQSCRIFWKSAEREKSQSAEV